MKRLLTHIPAPCSRCWVTVALKLERYSGLKREVGLVVAARLLLKPNWNIEPVTKPWLKVKLYWSLVVEPTEKKLVVGRWSRSNEAVAPRKGSRDSGVGPAPAVVSDKPLTPEPAPPEPTVVPPGPPPWRTWAIHQHDISGSIDRDLVRCCSWKRQTAARAGPERRAGPPARTDRAAPTWRLSCIFRCVSSRPAPRNLRASDADRDRVAALLSEAAGDGRLTLGEHSQRAEQAYSARTLGELASLTADLAAPAAQPIRLDGRRSVAGIFGQDRREGRWVVPESFPVTAICGDVVLDLREALLQSSRVIIYATVIAGQLEVMVPDGVAVEVTGTTILSRNKVPRTPQPVPGVPVIEIRLFAVAGTVKAVMPRRSRWPSLRRRGPVPRS